MSVLSAFPLFITRWVAGGGLFVIQYNCGQVVKDSSLGIQAVTCLFHPWNFYCPSHHSFQGCFRLLSIYYGFFLLNCVASRLTQAALPFSFLMLECHCRYWNSACSSSVPARTTLYILYHSYLNITSIFSSEYKWICGGVPSYLWFCCWRVYLISLQFQSNNMRAI